MLGMHSLQLNSNSLEQVRSSLISSMNKKNKDGPGPPWKAHTTGLTPGLKAEHELEPLDEAWFQFTFLHLFGYGLLGKLRVLLPRIFAASLPSNRKQKSHLLTWAILTCQICSNNRDQKHAKLERPARTWRNIIKTKVTAGFNYARGAGMFCKVSAIWDYNQNVISLPLVFSSLRKMTKTGITFSD